MAPLKHMAGVVAGLLGVAGNGLVFLTLWRTKNGWCRLNLQMTWLIAGVNTLCGLLVVVACSLAVGSRGSLFCAQLGPSLAMFSSTSEVLLGFMALDRCCMVVYNRALKLSLGWTLSILASFGLAGLLLANAIAVGLEPDPTRTYCRIAGGSRLTNSLRIALALTGASSLLVVSFCYTRIYLHCRKSLSVFSIMPAHCLAILAAYQLSRIPSLVVCVGDLFAMLPPALYMLEYLGLLLLQPIGPYLVFGFQSALRREIFPLSRLATLSDPSLPYSHVP